MIYSSLGFKGM